MANAKRFHELKIRRHRRLRHKVNGTPDRPRLSVFRSNRHIVAQVIDDTSGHTLVAASSLEGTFSKKPTGTRGFSFIVDRSPGGFRGSDP